MKKGVAVVLIIVFITPLAYSISIKELIARYNFLVTTNAINVISHEDFMIDKNQNGINDTLIFELTTNNFSGDFIFVINLFDKNGILTNETIKRLNSGTNKINLTVDSIFLSQQQFNYSIKIYNSSYSLKYRKDNILTQVYQSYEKGFEILDIKDNKDNKTLKIDITINSSAEGIFETSVFLKYNNSIIFAKENRSIINSEQGLIFNFDNEAIKRTHYIGNFNISSIKIGKKLIKTDFLSNSYDYKDFATTSYFEDFADNGVDADNDSKYDILQINLNAQILEDNYYTFILALYDLFDNLVEIRNVTIFLNSGNNLVSFPINGSRIYDKKLNGPFIVKYAQLYQNNVLIDTINDAYTTANYNFNDFDSPSLPDLEVEILTSDEFHYGINNVTLDIVISNVGGKQAFNVFSDIFDNETFSKTNKSNIINADSQIVYHLSFTDISDFDISAIADLHDFVEESNESNNADKTIIKINRKPDLEPVNNITVIETKRIVINLSASDPNEDELFFSINSSKFLKNNNIFEWNTTTSDSGDYTLQAVVSDGFLNDSFIFNVAILDVAENDLDGDGIDDTIDRLIGDKNSVKTSTINLTVYVNGSSNLSKLFNKNLNVKFLDGNLTILEFGFDFALNRLNLTNITINKQLPNQKGSLLVYGLKMPQKTAKTMYVDRINATTTAVCIKDAQITSLSEISKKCNLRNEFKIRCNGVKRGLYTCTYNSTSNKYKIGGLKHTGIIQVANTDKRP